MFDTPILYLIFNRPNLTKITFQSIRSIKPKKLFIAADGPRKGIFEDKEKCQEVREIVSKIDWFCDVKFLFRDENLGCGKAVSEAITWFFSNVDEGIILEDDCFPDESFFYFCSVLLNKYRDNEKIMHIGSNNFQNGIKRGNSDYYFSTIPHIWGWATWKRALDKYNFDLNLFSSNYFFDILKTVYKNKYLINYWIDKFISMSMHEIDTWDYQWHFAILKYQGIAISPNKNLVSNKGFGLDSTHTNIIDPLVSDLNRNSIFHIKHPKRVKICHKADLYTYVNIYKIKKIELYYQKINKKNILKKIKKIYHIVFSRYVFILNKK